MRSWWDALLLLLFTVSVPGVNHGPLRMEDLSAKLLLGLCDNWKILRGRLKSPCRAQRFGSHSQMRTGARWRARRAHREGAPNLSGNLRTAVEPEPPAAGGGAGLAVAAATPGRGYR